MKHFFNNQQPLRQCQSLSKALFSRLSSWSRSLFTHVRRSLSSVHARAKLAIRATLLASSSNWPKYLGYALVAFAVLTEFICRFFDPQGGDPLAYWNTYHYLFAIRSEISTILICTGAMLLMPRNMKEKWVLVVPCAYKFGRILWLAFVTTNEQYHQMTPFAFLLIGVAASCGWFVLFDYLMDLHFHKRQRKLDAAQGLLEAKNLDKDFQIQHALTEIIGYKNMN